MKKSILTSAIVVFITSCLISCGDDTSRKVRHQAPQETAVEQTVPPVPVDTISKVVETPKKEFFYSDSIAIVDFVDSTGQIPYGEGKTISGKVLEFKLKFFARDSVRNFTDSAEISFEEQYLTPNATDSLSSDQIGSNESYLAKRNLLKGVKSSKLLKIVLGSSGGIRSIVDVVKMPSYKEGQIIVQPKDIETMLY